MPYAKDGFKFCTKCKRKLPATNEFFCNNKNYKDKLDWWCKKCNREYSKKHFQDNKEEVNKKSREYYQDHKEERKENRKKYWQTPNGIYSIIKSTARAKNLPVCSKEDFIEWYNQQIQQCVYCDIPKSLLKPLEWGQKTHRNRFEIDRKDNDKGYLIDNICLACAACNTMKNNFVDYNSMKKIGKILKIIWKEKLNIWKMKNKNF